MLAKNAICITLTLTSHQSLQVSVLQFNFTVLLLFHAYTFPKSLYTHRNIKGNNNESIKSVKKKRTDWRCLGRCSYCFTVLDLRHFQVISTRQIKLVAFTYASCVTIIICKYIISCRDSKLVQIANARSDVFFAQVSIWILLEDTKWRMKNNQKNLRRQANAYLTQLNMEGSVLSLSSLPFSSLFFSCLPISCATALLSCMRWNSNFKSSLVATPCTRVLRFLKSDLSVWYSLSTWCTYSISLHNKLLRSNLF